MANTVSIAALRPEIWQKELYKDVIDGMYFTKNGLMGKDDNNIVQLKDELKKNKGDQVTFGLTTKLSGNGVIGDAELEGNEEAISSYEAQIAIDQVRNAVRLTGKLDEQSTAYNMRQDAKNKLSIWGQEFLERQIFMKLGSMDVTTLTDVNNVIYSGRARWSNTADPVLTADSGAGTGERYICAESTGLDQIAVADVLTTALITRARIKAKLASPSIRPLRVEGKDYYVMFIHPWQAADLKVETAYAAAQRDAQIRGSNNPIFTGALGIWDGVILFDHEYVPTSAASTNYHSGDATTPGAVRIFRSILCGRQAVGVALAEASFNMVEKTFDYSNKVGYSTGIIGGVQKVGFATGDSGVNEDYGVVTVDTSATVL